MAASHGTALNQAGAVDSTTDLRQLMEFASHAAHDLIGPVDQISSLVALFVQRYRGRLDGEADTLLSFIEGARTRLGITTAGLRKCFQLSTSQSAHEPVDMNGALQAARLSMAEPILQCGAMLGADPLPMVQGDRELLPILFQALLENALKFRREGVTPQINVSAAGSGNPVFQVSDNGIGIDPQYHEAVFQSFKKLNGHAYPGAGLGLTMARFIVELHGGSIWIEPAQEGTRVCFELPACDKMPVE